MLGKKLFKAYIVETFMVLIFLIFKFLIFILLLWAILLDFNRHCEYGRLNKFYFL